MSTRTSSSLKHAFKRFVELVEPIEDVRYVVAFDGGSPEVSTFIKDMDEPAMFAVFRAEGKIMTEFPELLIDFHVWFLDDSPIEDFVSPLPSLFYSNSTASGKRRST